MINEFAHISGVSEDDLLGRSRIQYISEARQLYWYLLWKSGYSFREIAVMGNRKRSTVSQLVRKVDFLIGKDKVITRRFEGVKHLIKERW